MNPIGKVVKVILAVVLAVGLMWSAQSFAADTKKAPAPAPTPAAAPAKPTVRTVELAVTEKGYEPSPVTLKKGEPVKLLITRKTEQTCANEIIIDEHKVNAALPLNKQVEVSFTPNKTGQLKYGCAMGKMIAGIFVIE